jgi:glyoxylase-like metal-dependent hydrolase (beta-lactamase superfamily II)/quercetin dioxygenase-like cupin family protein
MPVPVLAGHSRRRAVVIAIMAACAHPPAGPGAAAGVLSVGRYASPSPGSVNTFWVETRHGVVVIDGQRSLSDARAALARIQALGKPIRAIFLTHAHPDHYGGVGVLVAAAPGAPLYGSAMTRDIIASDTLGYFRQTKAGLGDDFADRPTPPTVIAHDGERFEIDGVTFTTSELGAGEAASATVVSVPAERIAFVGDAISDRATPALIQGMSLAWIGQLDLLAQRSAGLQTIYPGHGEPGPPAELINRQREYLETFRRLVKEHMQADGTVGAEPTRAVVAATDARYPGYQPVARPVPNLLELDIQVVARELAGLAAIGPPPVPPHPMEVIAAADAKFVSQEQGRSWGAKVAMLSGTTEGPSAALLKFKKGPIPFHWHSSPYHAVVLAGRVKHWASGESESAAKPLGPGSYWFQPAREVHTDACLEDGAEYMLFVYTLGKMDMHVANSPGK